MFNRISIKSCLVLSSLVPLEVLLLIKFSFDRLIIGAILGFMILIGLAGLFFIVQRSNNSNPFAVKIESVEDAGPEVTGYLASFVLPLIAVKEASFREWLMYIVFMVVYIIILNNSQLLAVNPMLYIFGYRIWKIDFIGSRVDSGLFIGKERPTIYDSKEDNKFIMTGDNQIYLKYKKERVSSE